MTHLAPSRLHQTEDRIQSPVEKSKYEDLCPAAVLRSSKVECVSQLMIKMCSSETAYKRTVPVHK